MTLAPIATPIKTPPKMPPVRNAEEQVVRLFIIVGNLILEKLDGFSRQTEVAGRIKKLKKIRNRYQGL